MTETKKMTLEAFIYKYKIQICEGDKLAGTHYKYWAVSTGDLNRIQNPDCIEIEVEE